MPSFFDKTTARALATIGLFLGICALVYVARRTFITFIFAIFFAYLLEPVVWRVQVWMKSSRNSAVAATYVALIVLLVVFALTAGPRIVHEGQKLAQTIPTWFDKLGSGQLVHQIGSKRGWSYQTEMRVQSMIASHRAEITRQVQDLAARAAAAATYIAWIVLVPILAIFFLRDKWEFISGAVEAVENRHQQKFLRKLLTDLDTMLARYIRAQLILAGMAAFVYTGFFSLMRVPYGFVLGAIAGLLEFIPFAGPLITAVLVVGISFLTGYQHIFALLAFLGVWRLTQDYVNAPRVLGRGLELHPLAAIFGILVGGEVAGVLGIFLSVPSIAALRIVWRNWQMGVVREGPRPTEVRTPEKAA